MKSMVVVDTDILSMFAKADAIKVLQELLGKDQIGITPAIADELSIPLQYGYTFPIQIFSQIPVVSMNTLVTEELARLRLNTTLGRGEKEAIAFCKMETAKFATNDRLAQQFAQNYGVSIISLQAILRGLWASGMMTTVEVWELLEQIRQTDHLEVSAQVINEIFGNLP